MMPLPGEIRQLDLTGSSFDCHDGVRDAGRGRRRSVVGVADAGGGLGDAGPVDHGVKRAAQLWTTRRRAGKRADMKAWRSAGASTRMNIARPSGAKSHDAIGTTAT